MHSKLEKNIRGGSLLCSCYGFKQFRIVNIDPVKMTSKKNENQKTVPAMSSNIKDTRSIFSKGDHKNVHETSGMTKKTKKIHFKSALLPGFPERIQLSHDCINKNPSVRKYLLYHMNVVGHPLFDTVVSDQPQDAPSMLVTGFGLRNLASLEEALQFKRQSDLKHLEELQKSYLTEKEEIFPTFSIHESSTESLISSTLNTETSATQTEDNKLSKSTVSTKSTLLYLMGISDEAEEEERNVCDTTNKADQEKISKSMKQAQVYLQAHNIFKLFQFIIAHILSELPDDPVEFILILLNQCLLFRSNLCEPPLLYTKKHLERLFYLMDKLYTGYITLNQYVTGVYNNHTRYFTFLRDLCSKTRFDMVSNRMNTLGIAYFNNKPPINSNGLIEKEIFIAEAYNCLTRQLQALIRKKWLQGPPPTTPPPPPTPELSCSSSSDTVETDHRKITKTKMFFEKI